MKLYNNGEAFECDMTASELKFYGDVKGASYKIPVPKILFEELNDKDNMNLILYNTSDAKHILNYNEDLKGIIMTIDFTKDLIPSLLYKALSIVQLKTILPLKSIYYLETIFFNSLTSPE